MGTQQFLPNHIGTFGHVSVSEGICLPYFVLFYSKYPYKWEALTFPEINNQYLYHIAILYFFPLLRNEDMENILSCDIFKSVILWASTVFSLGFRQFWKQETSQNISY